jgi:predicted DNA-binding protein (MmcQ/YjbR family)
MPARDSQPGRTASRPVVERLRGLCLTLPETSERASWGHPNFRAGKKTFAAFEIIAGRPSIAFRLPPGDVEELLRGRNFFATPYGRGLWASLRVDEQIDWQLVDRLLRRSYRTVALKRMLAAMDKPQRRGRTGQESSDRTGQRKPPSRRPAKA